MPNLTMEQQWAVSELDGDNAAYLEALYADYCEDPNLVDAKWRGYFDKIKADSADHTDHAAIQEAFAAFAMENSASTAHGSTVHNDKSVAIAALIQAYREFGHLLANTDPLGLHVPEAQEALTLAFHGLTDVDLTTEFQLPDFNQGKKIQLGEAIQYLKDTYCQHVGFEYLHTATMKERHWLRAQIEQMDLTITEAERTWLLNQLVAADGLEKYLGTRYAGKKRFSLEGGDALIPMINTLINEASAAKMDELCIGMAHRGRLNVLVNVLGKTPEKLFSEFEGNYGDDLLAGDVMYHNGFSSDIQTDKGQLHVALAFNPSHLEIVSPVVEGAVAARQQELGDTEHHKSMAIQIHGDNAFIGQGVVQENFTRSQVKGYATGGSIHIVVNNQVGFTTNLADEARSSHYATDIAKMVSAPVFHVNGNDPEAVLLITRLAFAYRQLFHKDVVIDLVCYRLHGHNEADEPAATQPLMYAVVKKMIAPAKVYAQKLQANGLAENVYTEAAGAYKSALEHGESVVNLSKAASSHKAAGWAQYKDTPWDAHYASEVDQKTLVNLASKLDQLPEGFTPQRQVGKTLDDRAKMTAGEMPMNWGYAELLAYATLLNEGYFVRISGEDSQRGTFAHRHAVLHDNKNGQVHTPLAQLATKPAQLQILNSILSEEAIMAFEYGYSASRPDGLVIWEGQFGDFANGAQVVIDQFISSAEEKWGRYSGLALFLPHGQEGMGPEHSSARLERYLQLCANDNMQVCVPTTPAQIYHLIRRQAVRMYRKPLIVMTPKSLLRHPMVTSTLQDCATGAYQLVIPEVDSKIKPAQTRRLILCQGKVYYDLVAAREEKQIDNIAIVRIEQLYPFPEAQVRELLKTYANVEDIIWCQEEPENQGAWQWIRSRLRALLSDKQQLNYVGRTEFATPAVGYPHLAKQQQTDLIEQALRLK